MENIYKIECIATGRIYIGCTGVSPMHRVKRHLYELRANRHSNKLLQEDFNKFGIGEFKWQHLYTSEIPSGYTERDFQALYKTYDDRYGYNGHEKYWRAKGKPTKALKELMEK